MTGPPPAQETLDKITVDLTRTRASIIREMAAGPHTNLELAKGLVAVNSALDWLNVERVEEAIWQPKIRELSHSRAQAKG